MEWLQAKPESGYRMELFVSLLSVESNRFPTVALLPLGFILTCVYCTVLYGAVPGTRYQIRRMYVESWKSWVRFPPESFVRPFPGWKKGKQAEGTTIKITLDQRVESGFNHFRNIEKKKARLLREGDRIKEKLGADFWGLDHSRRMLSAGGRFEPKGASLVSSCQG